MLKFPIVFSFLWVGAGPGVCAAEEDSDDTGIDVAIDDDGDDVEIDEGKGTEVGEVIEDKNAGCDARLFE